MSLSSGEHEQGVSAFNPDPNKQHLIPTDHPLIFGVAARLGA
jgi:hypothetical protein